MMLKIQTILHETHFNFVFFLKGILMLNQMRNFSDKTHNNIGLFRPFRRKTNFLDYDIKTLISFLFVCLFVCL